MKLLFQLLLIVRCKAINSAYLTIRCLWNNIDIIYAFLFNVFLAMQLIPKSNDIFSALAALSRLITKLS